MRIAIIGGGISGMTAAYYLSRRHDITLFEASDYIGGHANTALVKETSRTLPVDTGFIVFNEHNYPGLCRLFDELEVEAINTDMSFSVHCEASGLEYNGTSLNKLFVQRRNIFNFSFLHMLKDISRFNKEAIRDLQQGLDDTITVEDYARQNNYSEVFIEQYLVPLGASLWSSPADRFRQFPMLFVIEFLNNHCMLQVSGRPQWKTVKGGSKEYVKKLTASYAERIQLNQPVQRVSRRNGKIEVETRNNNTEEFDEAIVCCHSDQALQLLDQADETERGILEQFQYQQNEAVLHTDTRVLPMKKDAWASWNYRIPEAEQDHVSVTYNMNSLQSIESDQTYCVSLNQTRHIDKSKIIKRIIYHHPQFTPGRSDMQGRHQQLIRHDGISYCGAYWGYGFHEDGVSSATRVCEAFDLVAK
ncbi:MAG: FAD-dependent oxidoreductase [Gammaproteobacteria bacterium]